MKNDLDIWTKRRLETHKDWLRIELPDESLPALSKMFPDGPLSLKKRMFEGVEGTPHITLKLGSNGCGYFVFQSHRGKGKPVKGISADEVGNVIFFLEGRVNLDAYDGATITHDQVMVAEDYRDKGLGKKAMANIFGVYQDVGIKKVDIEAFGYNGAYTWARLGFKPCAHSFDKFKPMIKSRFGTIKSVWEEKNSESFPADIEKTIEAILKSSDPRALWLLVDDVREINGEKLGKALLKNMLNFGWQGSFDFRDEESVNRFNAYVPEANLPKLAYESPKNVQDWFGDGP